MNPAPPAGETRSATAVAPGKINVHFAVGPLRDDGYHDVASLYLALNLHERVTALAAPEGEFVAELSEASSIEVDPEAWPSGEANLAVKAAKLLAEHTGVSEGARFVIEKHVPIAGGMGGGSADAAAALVACDSLWGTGLTREELGRLAERLGADVPFALSGGAAVGLGVGERLSPLLHAEPTWWVLLPASYGLSTPRVYGRLDELRGEHSARTVPLPQGVPASLVQGLRDGDELAIAGGLHNDLQAAALSLAPELSQVFQAAAGAGALGKLVSGSGPTVAVFAGRDPQLARSIALQLSDELEVRAIVASGPARGAHIVR
ncbi:MAG: 4-(cytidine 5'-diphospho)-2-C-methyl-D-erythritol kinase [Arthrobacter sp.]|nr:4-(cytidine 5'-diphospho)-2-C-methyl-D-erythritol kinase [Arthrobacter sp.]